MGCASSQAENNTVSPEANEVAQTWQEIHSIARWQKDMPKLLRTLEQTPSHVGIVDPKNLNTPLHISAQNGHYEMTQIFIAGNADVNARNAKGQTALHMAMSYDYYDVVKILLDAGADGNQKNDDGFRAIDGLEGDCFIGNVQLTSMGELAKEKAEEDEEFTNFKGVNEAFDRILAEPSKTDKVNFARAGLSLKKNLGPAIWDEYVKDRFYEILPLLPASTYTEQA
jgi:hypothetical protein